MKVPFLNLKPQLEIIKNKIEPKIKELIHNTTFIGGPTVKEFEENYAKKNNSKHFISCANGTDAIYLVLRALGIGYGDEVLVPANTFIASAEPISSLGAVPVFVDQEKDYYHINSKLIEDKITPRTKAIIPVHLYGQAVQMNVIVEIANKHNLFIIEDCAQAHFAKYNRIQVGNYGIAGTYSFYPGKNLGAFGDAGGIVTNDDNLSRKIRLIANHGSLKKHHHEIEGVNSRIDSIQAAVLNIKLDYINAWNQARYQKSKIYNDLLKDIPQVDIPKKIDNSDHINHLYVVRVERRKELMAHLKENGVASGLHYANALPYMPPYKRLNYTPEDFPVAYDYQSKILSLPMFPELSLEQIEYVVKTIKEYYQK